MARRQCRVASTCLLPSWHMCRSPRASPDGLGLAWECRAKFLGRTQLLASFLKRRRRPLFQVSVQIDQLVTPVEMLRSARLSEQIQCGQEGRVSCTLHGHASCMHVTCSACYACSYTIVAFSTKEAGLLLHALILFQAKRLKRGSRVARACMERGGDQWNNQ
jgi:hypothetical protein